MWASAVGSTLRQGRGSTWRHTAPGTPPPRPAVWLTNVVPGGVAPVTLRLLQRQDLEGRERSGPGLGGDHASEACHRPRAHVIVVRTDWEGGERERAAQCG